MYNDHIGYGSSLRVVHVTTPKRNGSAMERIEERRLKNDTRRFTMNCILLTPTSRQFLYEFTNHSSRIIFDVTTQKKK